MPKYLCMQRSASGDCEPPSPAQMQSMYEVFNAWREKYQKNIVDMGGRLRADGKIVSSEGAIDGPFPEAKEVIGGFMIIEAANMDEAVEVARQCPGVVAPGSSVEVREISAP
ncbi:MAG: YciI family protein [Myxococcales bacterium]|nr:YciI family protein [Myxococcales bacterium]